MNVKQQVLKFIEKEDLFKSSDHLLLAVSGGMDSMTMLHLLMSMDYNLQVAHINYKLRGTESDLDQQLVERYCTTHNIICHSYTLNDNEVKDLKSSNLQEKARDIRYSFFKEICSKYNIKFICTAHHTDDRIETSLLNLTRGAGLNGITSLKAKSGIKRRPLLNLSKSHITNYVQNQAVPYRQDKSNLANDYDRNFIRNEVITKIYKRIPRSQSGWKNSLQHLQDEAELLNYLIKEQRTKWIELKDTTIKIGPISRLKDVKGAHSLVFRWLTEYSYNYTDVVEILTNGNNNGAHYLSDSHDGIIHLDHLLIRKKNMIHDDIDYKVNEGENILLKGTLSIKKVESFELSQNPNVEYINGAFISFPLTVRSWNQGDRYQPIGLNGKSKKISDLFTDLKFNKFEKQETLILTDNDKIIWVISHRLDNRYKVTEQNNSIIYQLIYTPTEL